MMRVGSLLLVDIPKVTNGFERSVVTFLISSIDGVVYTVVDKVGRVNHIHKSCIVGFEGERVFEEFLSH